MKNMSFALTTQQVRDRSKTVTRRLGWKNAKPGDIVQPVVKGQGIPKGGKVEKIGGPIRFTNVRREPLYYMRTPNYGAMEVMREGGRWATGEDFIKAFTAANRCGDAADVTRIEFEYVETEWP